MDIAFCINHAGLAGFGATLNSLLGACTDFGAIDIHILESNLTDRDKYNIAAVCKARGYGDPIKYHSFDPEESFGWLPALHGDRTTYGRLLLPDLIGADRVLYLDADLVIERDVTELSDFPLDGKLVGAYSGTALSYALDQSVLERHGMALSAAYFNAGVLLINLEVWRATEVERRWRALAEVAGADLVSHDQTILNHLCGGDFALIPEYWNRFWLAHAHVKGTEGCIIHYVGAPKPWDLLGSLTHNGYAHWRRHQPKGWDAAYGVFPLSLAGLKRLYVTRRSLARTVLKREQNRRADAKSKDARLRHE